MSITDPERVEIFGRIGQLEGARVNEASHIKAKSSGNGNGGGAKAFASVLVIVAIIGGMAAIITPIRQQIQFITNKLVIVEKHASDGHPERVESRVDNVKNMIEEHYRTAEVHIRTINRLEQEVSVLKEQMLSGTKDRYYVKDAEKDNALLETKIQYLLSEISELKEIIKDANLHVNH